ncbi:MAG: transcriptional coactivator p15/PC4 family protein [Spirochaetales bacterium]|nr:transcriptional coactivator p15/PC4 family protein [Spirochaetales bacterium]
MDNQETEIARLGFSSDGITSEREPVFITVSEFRGQKYLNIRKYYEDNGTWHPTKKGITIRKDQFSEILSVFNAEKENILRLLGA